MANADSGKKKCECICPCKETEESGTISLPVLPGGLLAARDDATAVVPSYVQKLQTDAAQVNVSAGVRVLQSGTARSTESTVVPGVPGADVFVVPSLYLPQLDAGADMTRIGGGWIGVSRPGGVGGDQRGGAGARTTWKFVGGQWVQPGSDARPERGSPEEEGRAAGPLGQYKGIKRTEEEDKRIRAEAAISEAHVPTIAKKPALSPGGKAAVASAKDVHKRFDADAAAGQHALSEQQKRIQADMAAAGISSDLPQGPGASSSQFNVKDPSDQPAMWSGDFDVTSQKGTEAYAQAGLGAATQFKPSEKSELQARRDAEARAKRMQAAAGAAPSTQAPQQPGLNTIRATSSAQSSDASAGAEVREAPLAGGPSTIFASTVRSSTASPSVPAPTTSAPGGIDNSTIRASLVTAYAPTSPQDRVAALESALATSDARRSGVVAVHPTAGAPAHTLFAPALATPLGRTWEEEALRAIATEARGAPARTPGLPGIRMPWRGESTDLLAERRGRDTWTTAGRGLRRAVPTQNRWRRGTEEFAATSLRSRSGVRPGGVSLSLDPAIVPGEFSVASPSAGAAVDIGSFGSGEAVSTVGGGGVRGLDGPSPVDYAADFLGGEGLEQGLASLQGIRRPGRASGDLPWTPELSVRYSDWSAIAHDSSSAGSPGYDEMLERNRESAVDVARTILKYLDHRVGNSGSPKRDLARLDRAIEQYVRRTALSIYLQKLRDWKNKGKKGEKPDKHGIEDELAGLFDEARENEPEDPPPPPVGTRPHPSDSCAEERRKCQEECGCPCICTEIQEVAGDNVNPTVDDSVRGPRMELGVSEALRPGPPRPSDVDERMTVAEPDEEDYDLSQLGEGIYAQSSRGQTRRIQNLRLRIRTEEAGLQAAQDASQTRRVAKHERTLRRLRRKLADELFGDSLMLFGDNTPAESVLSEFMEFLTEFEEEVGEPFPKESLPQLARLLAPYLVGMADVGRSIEYLDVIREHEEYWPQEFKDPSDIESKLAKLNADATTLRFEMFATAAGLLAARAPDPYRLPNRLGREEFREIALAGRAHAVAKEHFADAVHALLQAHFPPADDSPDYVRWGWGLPSYDREFMASTIAQYPMLLAFATNAASTALDRRRALTQDEARFLAHSGVLVSFNRSEYRDFPRDLARAISGGLAGGMQLDASSTDGWSRIDPIAAQTWNLYLRIRYASEALRIQSPEIRAARRELKSILDRGWDWRQALSSESADILADATVRRNVLKSETRSKSTSMGRAFAAWWDARAESIRASKGVSSPQIAGRAHVVNVGFTALSAGLTAASVGVTIKDVAEVFGEARNAGDYGGIVLGRGIGGISGRLLASWAGMKFGWMAGGAATRHPAGALLGALVVGTASATAGEDVGERIGFIVGAELSSVNVVHTDVGDILVHRD